MKIEILEYRELIRELVKHTLKKRYTDSILGFLWYFFEPLILLGVIVFVFTTIFPMGIENFAIYLLIGLTILRFFRIATNNALESIVLNGQLIKKIYFPREVYPIVHTLVGFISVLFDFLVIFIFMIVFSVAFHITLLFVPLILLLEILIVVGISLIVSALFVRWRDLNVVWRLFLEILFWFCPIVYPITFIPSGFLKIYLLNPITLLIENLRSVILYGSLPDFMQLLYVFIFGITLIGIGVLIFNRRKRYFAEEI